MSTTRFGYTREGAAHASLCVVGTTIPFARYGMPPTLDNTARMGEARTQAVSSSCSYTKSSEYGDCQPLYSFSDCAGVSTGLAGARKAGTRTCQRMIGPPFVIWYGASSFEIPLVV
jgi:hypothetical protein